jgi:hypothetical protein
MRLMILRHDLDVLIGQVGSKMYLWATFSSPLVSNSAAKDYFRRPSRKGLNARDLANFDATCSEVPSSL